MADVADDAGDLIDLEDNIRRSQISLKPEVEATGACLNCDEPLVPLDVLAKIRSGDTQVPENTRKFCDKLCASDWQHRRDLLRRR